jgi:type I restriction enzyme S subunit
MIIADMKYKKTGIDWLPEIPEHWRIVRLKNLADVYGRIGFRGYTVADIVDEGKGAISLSPSNIIDQNIIYSDSTFISLDKYYESPEIIVEEGDTILVKTASVGKAALIRNLETKATINPQLVVFKNYKTDRLYFYYLIISHLIQKQIERDTSGGVVGTITQQKIKNYLGTFPPLNEQKIIANYLDNKSHQITYFIQTKQRFIELLKEQKQSIITNAVTKGINEEALMKETGIDWMPQIPSHWECIRIKNCCEVLRGKFTHRPRNDERLYNGKFPFIQTGDVSNAKMFIETYSQTLNEWGYSVSKEFPQGTLCMTIAANIADVAILNFNACFPDSIVGFKPKTDIDIKYLFYLFTCMKQFFYSVATISTQYNLNIERIAPAKIAIPPSNEQKEIIKYIQTETLVLEKAISKAEREIELIKEYREAMITEAVTGKRK